MIVNVFDGHEKAESILLRGLAGSFPDRLARGLSAAGYIIERQTKHNLSGPSHSKFPGNSNPYPGLVSTDLRESIGVQLAVDGKSVRIGPRKLRYAAIQEFGGSIAVTEKMRRYLHVIGIHLRTSTSFIRIPPRPYLSTAWEQKKGEVLARIKSELMGGIVV